MKKLINTLRPALLSFLILTVICGILYPMLITGIGAAIFPSRSKGSIIYVNSGDSRTAAGSALIGQRFIQKKYLIGRPMGTSNLNPLGEEAKTLVNERVRQWRELDPANTQPIPADLITASASGVDPYISPEAAEYQVQRIAAARNMMPDQIRDIIKQFTLGRFLGFWGEPGVNVLKVNLALDGLL